MNSNEVPLMDDIKPNVRQYFIDYLEKHCNDKAYIEEADRLLQSYKNAKDSKVNRLEAHITEGEIKKNYYENFLGFRCCDIETICLTHGNVYDISGEAYFIDEKLARKNGLRFKYPDSLTIEVKQVLEDDDKSFSKGQIRLFNAVDAVISLAGYHSYMYGDTGCPVIHPVILSNEEYQKEVEFRHGLGTKKKHKDITDFLTIVFNNDPLYYGDKKRGKENRDMAMKALNSLFEPRCMRSEEMAVLSVALSDNPFDRMPNEMETDEDFYDRFVEEVKIRMDQDSPDRLMDVLYWHPISHSKLYFKDSGVSREMSVEDGTLFEKMQCLEITPSYNYVFKMCDGEIVFDQEIVKRIPTIKPKIQVVNNVFPLLGKLFGDSLFPRLIPSKNLHTEACKFCTDFKVDKSYIPYQQKKKMSESRASMGIIRKNNKKIKREKKEKYGI